MPNLVLITGPAGWLGRNLLAALTSGPKQGTLTSELNGADLPYRGARVRCLALPGEELALPAGTDTAQVEILRGDLRDPDARKKFLAGAEGALLIHTAGVIHPRRVADFYSINSDGAGALLELAGESRVKRAVVISSNSPFGFNPHPGHLFDESSEYHPYQNYGRSKMKLELKVQALQRAGKLETVVLRPPWFYGPWQPPRQSQFFRMIRDGKMPTVGSGENLRSMVYLGNLSQAVLLAGVAPAAAGKAYWIADDRPYSMNEIVDTVGKVLAEDFGIQVSTKRSRLPGFASTVAGWLDSAIQGLGLYEQRIHVLSELGNSIACSVKTARAELGYRPQISLREGMRRSIDWCLAAGIKI